MTEDGIPQTAEEMVEHIKMLADSEIVLAIINDELPVEIMANKDFKSGVCFGILAATKQMNKTIPDHLKKMVKDALEQKKANN
jgi:hypothetical protein